MRRVLSGLLGGAVGTAAMTLVMRRLHRRLPAEDRHPLPPRHVAMALAKKSGVGPPRQEEDRKALTLLAHYAYGTAVGGAYALVAPRTRWAPIAGSLPFGFAVWAGSYLGLLPLLELHPPATEESAPRNALMIASHFVWAGTIAAVVEALAADSPRRTGSRR